MKVSSYFLSEFGPVIVFYVLLTVFLIMAYRFLRKRRIKQINTLPHDWHLFETCVENNKIAGINTFGLRLIWNEQLTLEQRKRIYEVVKDRIENYPELKELWGYAHYKRLGFYPPEE